MPTETLNPAREESLNYLNKIIEAQTILSAADFNLDKFMHLVVAQVESLTLAIGVIVELVEGDELVYRATSGTAVPFLGARMARAGSLSGTCLAEKKVLYCEDTETDSRVNLALCRKIGLRSMLVAPLIYGKDAVGVIKIYTKQVNGFGPDEHKTLEIMAGIIASMLAHQVSHDHTEKLLSERTKALEELSKAEEKLQYLANHDKLTDLANRHLFNEKIEQVFVRAQRGNYLFAVMYMDLDRFKLINDTYGHEVGDAVLKIFAARLKQCVRASDTVSRFGGDEFVVLLEGIPDYETVTNAANKILEKIREPFAYQSLSLEVHTSIGISIYQDEIKEADQLVCEADKALYQAKKAGRNTYKISPSSSAS